MAARLPAPAGHGIRTAAAALDVAARLIASKPLADLAPPERDWVCTAVASGGGAALIEALKMPVLLAAGAERFSGAQRSTVGVRSIALPTRTGGCAARKVSGWPTPRCCRPAPK